MHAQCRCVASTNITSIAYTLLYTITTLDLYLQVGQSVSYTNTQREGRKRREGGERREERDRDSDRDAETERGE